MRLAFSSFVNNLFISINRAPGQIHRISGWLNITIFEVACRMCGVKPTVYLFSALFSVSHNSFQTTISSRKNHNILAGARPSKVSDIRWHKKFFFVQGGMAIGVPYIWTLQEEAKRLPICTTADIDVVAKILFILP
ncbi:hypothetical protein LIER_39099 [Lithospermum erythrorhizon]|uniref:Uncharacterized protein n=1 Tax=Lithospermum erythrorhizon TaxID=34254 RepID=A0AAV3QCW9_LITER